MSQEHIRIVRTPEVEKVLSYLRTKFTLFSEAKIIKIALSEKYRKEIEENTTEEKKVRAELQHAMTEGRKLDEKLMKENGLDQEQTSDKEFYDHILDAHKS